MDFFPEDSPLPLVLMEGLYDMGFSPLDMLAVSNKPLMLLFIFVVKFDGFLALVTLYHFLVSRTADLIGAFHYLMIAQLYLHPY